MIGDVPWKARADPGSSWVWGAFRLSGTALRSLYRLWLDRDRRDEYIGTLVNAWLERGGTALAVPAGTSYMDVGTLHGYREAVALLSAGSGSAKGAVA